MVWWLTRLDTADPDRPLLDHRTVFVVDEASTVSTRDLHRLLRHVHAAGATLRIVTADTPAALLDALVADWYVDRQQHLADPNHVKPSLMMAEHHIERVALNPGPGRCCDPTARYADPTTTSAGNTSPSATT